MAARRLILSLIVACVLSPSVGLAQWENDSESGYFDSDTAESTQAQFASFLQPRLQTPAESVSPEPRQRSARSSQRNSYIQLARAPNMFGDILINAGQIALTQRNEG